VGRRVGGRVGGRADITIGQVGNVLSGCDEIYF